jgi:hypothetical protein
MPFVLRYRSMNGRHGFEPAILFALLYIRANGFFG